MAAADLLPMLKLNLEIITDFMDAEAIAAKDAELAKIFGASVSEARP